MHQQNGYVLLLGLIVLIAISSAWLVGRASPNISLQQQRTIELSRAREALISYAVNYIDHYGPQGAGVGHFPCPDTDPPTAITADPWYLDGPNPPCGKHQIATGWLPRHVNVSGGRYHFHARQYQRLRYAVSGRFINNPVNREVNPSTVGDVNLDQFNDVVAVLVQPHVESMLMQDSPAWPLEQIAVNDAVAIVRVKDILKPILRRAGSWLVGQLNMVLALHCNAGFNACDHQWSLHSECGRSPDEVGVQVLYWLANNFTDTSCDDSIVSLLSLPLWLEGVPIKKHWFVRNRWYQFVDLKIDQACLQGQIVGCRFVLGRDSLKVDRIQLLLSPVEVPTY